MNCIFCKIANGEIKSDIVFQNDKCVVFRDINPKAPVHLLAIHKSHSENISDTENPEVFAELFSAVRESAKLLNLDEQGYRIIMNNGKAAHQEVYHMHAHILGGASALGPLLAF